MQRVHVKLVNKFIAGVAETKIPNSLARWRMILRKQILKSIPRYWIIYRYVVVNRYFVAVSVVSNNWYVKIRKLQLKIGHTK